MPYLSWETDKTCREISGVVQAGQHTARGKVSRREPPQGLSDAAKEVLKATEKYYTSAGKVLESEFEFNQARPALGQYLLNIAQVYKAMDIAADIDLLRTQNSSLCVRQTLAQASEGKLSRDEDQVLWRSTSDTIYGSKKILMIDQLWICILDNSE